MNTDLHFTCFVAAPDGEVRKAAAKREHTTNVAGSATAAGGSHEGPIAVSQPTPESSGASSGDATMAAPIQPLGQMTASGTTPAEGQLEGMRLIELDGRRPYPVDHGPCVDVLDVRIPPLFQ